MSDEELRELFGEMRDEPVPADSLVRMRAKLETRRRARAWPRWAMAVLVLSTVLAVIVLVFRSATPVPRVNAPMVAREVQAPATPPVAVQPEPVRRVRQAVRRRARRSRPAQAAEKPILIRIETTDPDVVILLVGE